MIPTPILDELQALLEKATPSNWSAYVNRKSKTYEVQSDLGAVVHWMGFDCSGKPQNQQATNAKLIALLKNNAPALIAAARQLEEVRRELADLKEPTASGLLSTEQAGDLLYAFIDRMDDMTPEDNAERIVGELLDRWKLTTLENAQLGEANGQ